MEENMKILIVCNSASGLEVFRGMLIRRLIKDGNIVSSIIPKSAKNKELNAVPSPVILTAYGIFKILLTNPP